MSDTTKECQRQICELRLVNIDFRRILFAAVYGRTMSYKHSSDWKNSLNDGIIEKEVAYST
jgi:hypothetical protein